MYLNEIVKSFIKQPDFSQDKQSSVVEPDNIIRDLDQDTYQNIGSFFDDTSGNSLFGDSSISDTVFKQKEKILKYRQLSMITDVSEAIDEIVNEIMFEYDGSVPIKLDVNEENEKLQKAIDEKFQKILKLMNIKRNFYQIIRQSYVDGSLVLHANYDKKNTKNGIQAIKMIDPKMFYFDATSKTWKYMNEDKTHMAVKDSEQEYSIEEIVREDFGLYDGPICLSYLEHAIKPANMLKTLEDLLIPLRFSRSISRRVFNVDIGDLPTKRGAEVMREYQNKFKYKKFYNNETGEVSNQQHITSMVEDYWFSNRSGGKGTTVDVLDETGNLGELDDILYFARKLYRSLKIPSNRMSIDPNSEPEFDYETTRVSKEDMKFFMFISRLRLVYTNVFKELLKREVISTGVMTEDEWDDKQELIEISFTNENSFIQKMKLDNFMSMLDIYRTAQDYQGKIFSVETILKDIFKFTDEQIKEELKKIKAEEQDPLYKNIYNDDDGF